MTAIDDLPRDPNAAPLFDANGEPWAQPDPEVLQRIFDRDRTEALWRAWLSGLGWLLEE